MHTDIVSDKAGFRTKNVARYKGHFTMTKGTIQQDTIILNVSADNNKTPKQKKQKLTELKGDIYANPQV